jgi:hypothetical protein
LQSPCHDLGFSLFFSPSGRNPALRISNLADWLPFYQTKDLATLASGLRQAGLPE